MKMYYMLNGGRNERGVLVYPEAQALYKTLGIKRVLFIVYALVEEYWQQRWQKAGALITIPGMDMRSLTIYDTDPMVITEALQWADYVYFPGGSQESLLSRMHALGTDVLFESTLAVGSVKLLGGGSAGAMVMGSHCIVGQSEVRQLIAGLDVFPQYVVDSHFSQRDRLPRLQAIIDQNPSLQGLGIDEDTAVVFDAQRVIKAVYGPGSVTECTTNGIKLYDTHTNFSR